MDCPAYLTTEGPLGLYQDAFWLHIVSLGYKPQPSVCQMHLFSDFSQWIEGVGRTASSIDYALLDAFLIQRRKNGIRRRTTIRSLFAIMSFLEREGIVEPTALQAVADGPHCALLVRYRAWLIDERSIVPHQACKHSNTAARFLCQCVAESEPVDLKTLTPAHVLDFVHAHRVRYRENTLSVDLSSLRTFLHFLFLYQLTEQDLRGAVPSVAHTRQKSLPVTLDADEVRRVLESCDRSSHGGRRDHAILLLLLRLGWRRGDVAALRLDDIDWKAGELRVSGKTGREERLPLPEEVGSAIAEYLRHSRPVSTERQVFFTLHAPIGPIHSCTVSNLIKAAFARADFPAGYTPRLRHTTASLLLGAGASLDEIAQVLRHRSTETTALYAKIDERALSELVQEWPEASS